MLDMKFVRARDLVGILPQDYFLIFTGGINRKCLLSIKIELGLSNLNMNSKRTQ